MTKKILSLILLATLFVACGDDKDDKEYYNPIEGDWLYTTPLGSTETRVYTDKFDSFTVTRYNGKIKVYEHGIYKIDSKYVYYKDDTHKYRIEKDTLWLEGVDFDWKEKKYIRVKE